MSSAPQLIKLILPTQQLSTVALSTTSDNMNLAYTTAGLSITAVSINLIYITAAHSCLQHQTWFCESCLHHSCPELPLAPQLQMCWFLNTTTVDHSWPIIQCSEKPINFYSTPHGLPYVAKFSAILGSMPVALYSLYSGCGRESLGQETVHRRHM